MNRTFDEKTKVTNVLTSHYIDHDDRNAAKKRRIIRDAVNQIFSIRYFPRDPESAAWNRGKIMEILEKMDAKLERIAKAKEAA